MNLTISALVRLMAITLTCFFSLQMFSQDCPPNILQNADASDGMAGWNIISQSGSGWRFNAINKRFDTSYGNCPENQSKCRKSQLVDLMAAGYSADYLDSAPEINVGETVRSFFLNAFCYDGVDAQDPYYVRYELRDANQNVLASYNNGTPTNSLRASYLGTEERATFTNYGAGARYVYFEHGGSDSGFWNSWYGASFFDGFVTVATECTSTLTCPPDVVVFNSNDYAGLPEYIPSTDPCCATASPSYSDSYVGDNGCSPFIERTWSVPGRTCTQNIEVRNVCNFVCPRNTCSASTDEVDPADLGMPYASSGCGLDNVAYVDKLRSQCGEGDQVLRIWTANFDAFPDCPQTCSQVISIDDQSPPTLTGCPEDITVGTSADIVNWIEPVAMDNCVNVALSSTHTSGLTYTTGTTTVTYTAYDICGNFASCTFNIVVEGEDQTDCPADMIVSPDQNGNVSWEVPGYVGTCSTCSFDFIAGFNKVGSYGGSSYYVSKGSYSYSDASQMAADAGGHLVSIGSEEENTFLDDKLSIPVLIGLSDSSSEGNFSWSNGDDLSYHNWYQQQPNDYNGQDYVELLANGQWNDIGDVSREFVMEMPCQYVKQTAGPINGGNVPSGQYTVAYSISDGCGYRASCSYLITVMGIDAKLGNPNSEGNQRAAQMAQFKGESIICYPNPAYQDITIELGSGEEKKVNIYGLNGLRVYSKTTSASSLMVNLSQYDFETGTYIITVESGNDIQSKKLVVIK